MKFITKTTTTVEHQDGSQTILTTQVISEGGENPRYAEGGLDLHLKRGAAEHWGSWLSLGGRPYQSDVQTLPLYPKGHPDDRR